MSEPSGALLAVIDARVAWRKFQETCDKDSFVNGYLVGAAAERAAAAERERLWLELYEAVTTVRQSVIVEPVSEGEGVWIGHSGELDLRRLDAALSALREAGMGTP